MKKSVLRVGLCALLTANALLLGEPALPVPATVFAAEAPQTAAPAEASTIHGKIANISQKAKTLALVTGDGGFFLMKFTDSTVFKDGKAGELKEDEAIIAEYVVAGNENVATAIARDVVKLPDGIEEIKTEDLAKLVNDGQAVVIDSRPAVRYDEGHIPGAVSIPLAKLMAAGDDGAKLLAPYKDRQLIFYCGGST